MNTRSIEWKHSAHIAQTQTDKIFMLLNFKTAGTRAIERLTDTITLAAPRSRAGSDSGLPARRALIVDDDPDIPPLVECALSRYGISCQSVTSGAAALEAVRYESPNIIILDLGMPETSGFDVLRIIRADQHFARIPIVILTADHEDLALARSLGYGADDYVTKPFSPAQLAMRVYCLLRPRRLTG